MYSCADNVLKQCCYELFSPFKALTGGQAHSSLPEQPPTAFPEFRQCFIDFEAKKSNFEPLHCHV